MNNLAMNLTLRDDETSLIDSFSLNVVGHRYSEGGGGDSSSEEEHTNDSETSDVTWLTYRDENCNEVKEEFIRRLRLETRVLGVEERRGLLEGIVLEQRQRDEAEKQKRKKTQLAAESMKDLSLPPAMLHHVTKLTPPGACGSPHPAALFDANHNFLGVVSDQQQRSYTTPPSPPPSLPSNSFLTINNLDSSSPRRYNNNIGSIGGSGGGRITGGLDLVKEETRSDMRSERGSRSDASSQQQSSSHHQQHHHQYSVNQEHINSIVNLKLLVANQQAMIDTLTSRLHNSDLANNILQSENKILKKNDDLQRQQLIKKGREVVEAETLIRQQEQRFLLQQSSRLLLSSPTTSSSSSGEIQQQQQQNAVIAPSSSFSSSGGKQQHQQQHPPPPTSVSSTPAPLEQFSIQALESRLKKMDQAYKILMKEKIQLQRDVVMLQQQHEKEGGGVGGSISSSGSALVVVVDDEEKEEIPNPDLSQSSLVVGTREDIDAVASSNTSKSSEASRRSKRSSSPQSSSQSRRKLLELPTKNQEPAFIDVSLKDSSSVGEAKKLILDSNRHVQIPFVQNNGEWMVETARLTSLGVAKNQETPIKTSSVSSSMEKISSSDGGGSSSQGGGAVSSGRYGSVVATSNKIFGETKLFGGLVSRCLGSLSHRLIMRVEDLSKDLIPIVGSAKFCVMVYNVLSPEECAGLIRRAKGEQFEGLTYDRRSSGGEPVNISSCKRCRFGDSKLALDLFERISAALKGTGAEETFQRISSLEDGCKKGGGEADPAASGKSGKARPTVTRISEPFNVIRYEVGEFFAPHRDKTYHRGTEASRLTLQVFLNEKFSGGATSIRDGKKFFDIKPKVGSVLLVDQELRREECYVTSGKKYIVRADVMYDECKVEGVTGT